MKTMMHRDLDCVRLRGAWEPTWGTDSRRTIFIVCGPGRAEPTWDTHARTRWRGNGLSNA